MQGCLDFLQYVYGTFGFSFNLKLSTRPEKYLGDIQVWNEAEEVRHTHFLSLCTWWCEMCATPVSSQFAGRFEHTLVTTLYFYSYHISIICCNNTLL